MTPKHIRLALVVSVLATIGTTACLDKKIESIPPECSINDYHKIDTGFNDNFTWYTCGNEKITLVCTYDNTSFFPEWKCYTLETIPETKTEK